MSDEAATHAEDSGRSWLRPAALVVVAVLLIALARTAGGYLPALALWVDGLGFWGPLAFMLLYVAATVLFVPGVVLTLAGGAIFGLLEGTLYVFLGASAGATAAFLVSRYVARGWVEAQLGRSRRFAAMDQAVGRSGLKITFLLRLSPVFPFNVLNYALGLTRVALRDYVIACAGMLPATLLYVYYGRVIGDVAAVAGGGAERDTGYYLLMAVGLAATIAVTTVVTRLARRALAEVDELEGIEEPGEGHDPARD